MENNKKHYSELTYKDIKDLMDDLAKAAEKEKSNRTYVMYTGMQGFTMFDLAMQNMYMPTNVPYTYVNYKKLPHIYYLSIGKKDSRLKVVLNTRDKSYKIYWFTRLLFSSTNHVSLTHHIKELYQANKNNL
jgi:23S rRNA A1618 N6-methylase RlmF